MSAFSKDALIRGILALRAALFEYGIEVVMTKEALEGESLESLRALIKDLRNVARFLGDVS